MYCSARVLLLLFSSLFYLQCEMHLYFLPVSSGPSLSKLRSPPAVPFTRAGVIDSAISFLLSFWPCRRPRVLLLPQVTCFQVFCIDMAFLIAKAIHHSLSAEGPVISLFLHTWSTVPDCLFYSDTFLSSPISLAKTYSISNPQVEESHLGF